MTMKPSLDHIIATAARLAKVPVKHIIRQNRSQDVVVARAAIARVAVAKGYTRKQVAAALERNPNVVDFMFSNKAKTAIQSPWLKLFCEKLEAEIQVPLDEVAKRHKRLRDEAATMRSIMPRLLGEGGRKKPKNDFYENDCNAAQRDEMANANRRFLAALEKAGCGRVWG